MRILSAVLLVMAMSACAERLSTHGYAPSDAELSDVVVGVDTRDSLSETIGAPATSGVLAENAWYYVSTTVRHWAYQAPEPIERQLVAISFDEAGVVRNIERFGLEDGQVVTLSRRITDTSIREFGLVQQIMRNFGRINIGEALAE